MPLPQKLKTALDENRLLILGAQILMGFQFNGTFQDAFDELAPSVRQLFGLAFVLMTLTLGLLIAPAMQHRLVEYGEDTPRMHETATVYASLALLPLGTGLGLDVFIVLDRPFGRLLALAAGVTFFGGAMLLWFGLEWLWRRDDLVEKPMKKEKTPLHAKIEQMLTEARVLIPGAQALLGFQMASMLTSAFDRLDPWLKIIHACSLGCIALCIILLMAPAAFHRIAYGGEDSEEFHELGTKLVVAAALPLAAGIAGDLYVATSKALQSSAAGAALAAGAAAILLVLWYVQPLMLRRRHRR